MLRAWQIQHKGTPMFKVAKKLKKCTKLLKSWSRNIFGNVKSQINKKKKLLQKVKEAAVKEGSYEDFIQLRRELNVLLENENQMWWQRSRAQWVAKSDQNMKYFHGVATQKKRRNLSKGLETGMEFGNMMRVQYQIFLWIFTLNYLLRPTPKGWTEFQSVSKLWLIQR